MNISQGVKDVMIEFLQYINQRTDKFIFKGSLALGFCYGFPTLYNKNIMEFDAKDNANITKYVADFCDIKNLSYYTRNNDSQHETSVYMQDEDRNLYIKIVVSSRKATISDTLYINIYNIRVYKIFRILQHKILQFAKYGKIDDIYDIAYGITHHPAEFSKDTTNFLYDAVNCEGFSYLGDMIAFQTYESFPIKNFLSNYFQMLEKIGFVYDRNDFLDLSPQIQKVLKDYGYMM